MPRADLTQHRQRVARRLRRPGSRLCPFSLALILGITAALPAQAAFVESRIHFAGELWLNITNSGSIGSAPSVDPGRGVRYWFPGPRDDMGTLKIYWQPSFEFPGGSRINYLFSAGLMVGGVVGLDTLVSTTDGGTWMNAPEFQSQTRIRSSSTIAGSPDFHPDALSEQQYTTVYSDTAPAPNWPIYYDEFEQRPHRPLGLEVHQSSHAWSARFSRQFVIVDAWIINISDETIQSPAVGLRVDGDAIHYDFLGQQTHDDICGFIDSIEGPRPRPTWRPLMEEIGLAWIADNDGDPRHGDFTPYSPTGALGAMILRGPSQAKLNFNWWVPERSGFEWGPRRWGRQRGYAGSLGRPIGDRGRYDMMTNGEIDYSQVRAGLDFSAEGWAVPPQNIGATQQIAGGADSRFILSLSGLPDLAPGDSIPFTYALLAGANFHVDPANYSNNFDPRNPDAYIAGLDFTDLIGTARWARWVFDTPGVDTDGDGYAGRAHSVNCRNWRRNWICDQIWYEGDGVPDWSGPRPPSPPQMTVTTKPRGVEIRWSGVATELEKDPLSGRRDFEGYRVYASKSGNADDYALIAGWDRPDNYVRIAYFPGYVDWRRRSHPSAWRQITYPSSVAQWQEIMGDPAFDPAAYPDRLTDRAYADTTMEEIRDPRGRVIGYNERIQYSCWEPVGDNQGNVNWDHDRWVDNLIQQVGTRDTIVEGDTLSYGLYEFAISNLMGGDPIHVAVTTLDQGDYKNNLGSLESAPSANSEYVFQIYSPDVVIDSGIKVSVYPNPYKSRYRESGGGWTSYFEQGFEAPGHAAWTAFDRRIWFVHLPEIATIRIWSLDGDLIREIHHPDPIFSPYPSAVAWDLISRNQQAVRSGIYIYRVDSEVGSQLGKIVIIR